MKTRKQQVEPCHISNIPWAKKTPIDTGDSVKLSKLFMPPFGTGDEKWWCYQTEAFSASCPASSLCLYFQLTPVPVQLYLICCSSEQWASDSLSELVIPRGTLDLLQIHGWIHTHPWLPAIRFFSVSTKWLRLGSPSSTVSHSHWVVTPYIIILDYKITSVRIS